MSKRIKLKFSRVIPSFQFCRSKNPASSLIPSIHRLSPINPMAFDISYPNNSPVPPPSTPECLPIIMASSKAEPVGCCGACTKYLPCVCSSRRTGSPEYLWMKMNSRDSPKARDAILFRVNRSEDGNGRKKREEISENEETETLISSSESIFSYDSSFEFNCENSQEIELTHLGNRNKFGRLGRKKSKIIIRSPNKRNWNVEDKSVAIVKKSRDPYSDFKRSMLEMIMENEIMKGEELEELLGCYLTLNAREYHVVIVEVFVEIWKALFDDSNRI